MGTGARPVVLVVDDEGLVRAVGQRSRDARVAVKALALELVTSDEFLTRAPQGGAVP